MSKKYRILIESVLGGTAHSDYFERPDEFQGSGAIDPGLPINLPNAGKPSGLLVPVPIGSSVGPGVINNVPMWILRSPKITTTYLYDFQGSTYSDPTGAGAFTGLSDGGNESGTSKGNGGAYYDNYIYFARNTTIARYGPLNGSPSFTGDYWGSALGKAALTDTVYPSLGAQFNLILPNHFLHRHSDGRLYIADVVGNQGTIHYIATKKTTVEGDTDNASTFGALTFGFGLWPTAIETYGSQIVVALFEGDSSGTTFGKQKPAKVAFWDTTSQNFNQITWVEFPDSLITKIENVNGVLYFTSTNQSAAAPGFRVTRYIGGSSFEEVRYFPDGYVPLPGGVATQGSRLFFGSSNSVGTHTGPCVYVLGLRDPKVSPSLFTPLRSNFGSQVTALSVEVNSLDFVAELPIFAVTDFFGTNRVYGYSTGNFVDGNPWWWSQIYRVGMPFKITKISIPLAGVVGAGNTQFLTAKMLIDDASSSQTFTQIRTSTYQGKRRIVYRPNSLVGQNNFFLELDWGDTAGTGSLTVALPIIVEYELIDE